MQHIYIRIYASFDVVYGVHATRLPPTRLRYKRSKLASPCPLGFWQLSHKILSSIPLENLKPHAWLPDLKAHFFPSTASAQRLTQLACGHCLHGESRVLLCSPPTEEYKYRYSALLRLVHPESPTDQEEVVIRRGDLITLSLDFLYKEPSIYISAKCADVPLTTHEEFPKPENGPCLALDMVVWDMNNGNGTYISAFCDPCHNTSSIPEAGVCGCLVRFHGRVSPIKDWKAKICFEFPIIKNEREEQKKYRCVYMYASLVVGALK